jgi:hypothetical protein
VKIACARPATAAIAVLALTACGGSSSSKPASGSTPPASTPTQPTQSTASSGTSTGTTAVAGTPACRAGDLSLRYLGGQGATGHGELGFELRNTSSRSCHTFGYPGVLFLDKSGGALPTVPSHTTQDYFGSAPEVRLTLDSGQAASFRLGVTHGMTSTAGCTTAYGLQVIPPDDTATLHVAIANGGAYECRTVTVSPLRPGASAYPG